MLRGSSGSKGPRQLDVLLVFAILVAPVVLAILVSGQFTTLEVKVDVEKPIDDLLGLHEATLLRVNVSNNGDRGIVPHFFIYWSGETSNVLAPWSYGPGAILLPAHSSGVYTIEAPDLERSIPNGSLFFVRLYDEVTQEYAFSQVEKLVLLHPPILANPDFQFWSSQVGELPRPFDWSIATMGGPDDVQNLSQSNSNNTRFRIAIYEDGKNESSGWTALFLSQGLDARGVQSLRNSTLSLTVNPGFSYKANASSGYPLAFAGIEINDGDNVVWIAFSCCMQGEVSLPHQQIFVFNAPVGQSSFATLNLSSLVGSLSPTKAWWFSIGVASSQVSPGWYVAEFGGLILG
jgi:hypothetical protein